MLGGSMLGPVQRISKVVTYPWRREAGEIHSHSKLFLGSLHLLSALGNTFSSLRTFLRSALSFAKY